MASRLTWCLVSAEKTRATSAKKKKKTIEISNGKDGRSNCTTGGVCFRYLHMLPVLWYHARENVRRIV